jgi:hypothetical protein
MNKLSIQAVSGAIRATKGIIASTKYPSSSRRVRSTGIYAEKRRFSGEIILGISTSGYEHARKRAEEDWPKVIATLEAKGFRVIKKQEKSFGDSLRDYFVVELAEQAAA